MLSTFSKQDATLEGLRQQQMTEILAKLDAEPISIPLQAYYKDLNERVPSWDADTLKNGAKRFAGLWGPGRAQFFPNKVHGLHNTTSFTRAWNERFPHQPIIWSDLDIKLRSPPTWSAETRDRRYVLVYQAEAPLSQGLNELLQGPTMLDCGMFCQLLIWMAIRYLVGDTLFDALFKFRAGQFILTQKWNIPINQDGSRGNLLHYFYDSLGATTMSLDAKSRIETKTFYNHPMYLAKHPGGMGRLENVTRIDDDYIVFSPDLPQCILSFTDLNKELQRAFNAPQDSFDLDQLEMYTQFPQSVPSSGGSDNKTLEIIVADAKKYETLTLREREWDESREFREYLARGLCRVLNFSRLVRCLQDAQKAHLDGETDFNVLCDSKRVERADRDKALIRVITGK